MNFILIGAGYVKTTKTNDKASGRTRGKTSF